MKKTRYVEKQDIWWIIQCRIVSEDSYDDWEWENNLVMKYELFHMQKGNIGSTAFLAFIE